jgi:PAS domain S-box-containing protein
VVVACFYIFSAKMSLALLTPEGVAVFWPAAGIAAGVLIALGPSARWAVAGGTIVATVVANLLGDRNVMGAIVFALCNAGEALLAAALIERYFGPSFRLNRFHQVVGFLLAAAIASAISGVGGTLGFAVFHDVTASVYTTWRNWFLSDALGIIAVAPLVVGLVAAVRDPPGRAETIEGLIALAVLVAVVAVVIALPAEAWATIVPVALLFAVMLWIAARCRPVFAAAAAFIVALAIVWTTTIGVGHFGSPNLPMADRVLAARAGILAIAIYAYALAALFAERREREDALEKALTAGAVTTFLWDLDTGLSQRSANAENILGFEPGVPFTPIDFLERVHSEDRERFKAQVKAVSPENPAYTCTFRFKLPNGSEIWLEESARAEFDTLGQPVRIRGLTIDVTARRRSETERSGLTTTLDEQMKNLLARVVAVTRETRRSSDSVDAYADAIDERIRSMADVHSQLSRNGWAGAALADVIRQQLASRATDANATMRGPHLTLTVPAAQALAMTVHELATNAARFGALSSPHGRIEVEWTRGADGVTISWREIGGPAVAASPNGRYGATVIKDIVPRELGGAVDLEFAAAGVTCTIRLPARAVRANGESVRPA